MFSGFFFSAIGTAAAPPATLPGGTGLVTVAGGVGQKLDYGAAYTFARMNAAGTVMQFVDPVLSTGGLRSVSGQLAARLDPAGALDADVVGMRVRAALGKGTRIDGNDLAVALSPTGGLKFEVDGLGYKYDAAWYGFATLGSTANGLRVALNTSTMMVDGIGIGVDPAKVAVLSGGKTTAANARGLTVRAYDSTTAMNNVATTASPVAMLALSVSLAVGEVLDVTGLLASRSGTTNDFADLVISSAAGGAGTVYSTIAANWGNTACALHAQHVATVAGVHHISLRANHAATSFNVAQRRLSYKVWAS